jgi:hypothetical protein
MDQGAPGIGSEQSERFGEEDGGLGRLALENGPVRVVSVSVLFGSQLVEGKPTTRESAPGPKDSREA